MNQLVSKIQDSELEVMRVLWESGDPLPLIEIRRVLSSRCGWEDSTIKTLLRRLLAKDIVKGRLLSLRIAPFSHLQPFSL